MVRSMDLPIHRKKISQESVGFLVTGAEEEAVSEFSELAFKSVTGFVHSLRISFLHKIIPLSAGPCGPAEGLYHTQPNRCCLWGSFGITTGSWHGSIPRLVFPRLSPVKSEGAR